MANNFASSSVRPLTILTENDDVPGSKFDREPENYTVEQLKRWLKCRGLKQGGKRAELITRVTDCIKAGSHHILDVSIDDGKWFAVKVHRENSNVQFTSEFVSVPLLPKTGWHAFPSKDIPCLFNYGHIYFYALESIRTISNEQTNDENDEGLGHMTDKPLKNGRKYVDSDFVHDVADAKTESHYFIRCHVWPSMRSDLPHNVLVILSVISGAVIHASCEPCKVSALGRCSHVVALLLFLLDHIKKYGSTVSTPCTSQECSWNKGKKRTKDPRRLSDTQYPTKMKKSKLPLADFDPRPIPYRQVNASHINNFIINLQKISSTVNSISMWETQLSLEYSDYELDEEREMSLHQQTQQLIQNLTLPKLMEIPGTRDQSGSEKWFCERWLRLTASKCLTAYKLGQLVHEGTSNAAVRCFNFMLSHIWKIDVRPFQSYWMRYGLESEPKAVSKYEQQTGRKVESTGLWVNPKFPFLGCSPDGLVGEDGLIEIKSLKILKQHTLEAVTSIKDFSVLINQQCFTIQNGKCVLKQKHDYYHQVQMQLLVTERKFCDFILFADIGPVSVERIVRNESLISEILKYLTTLWKQVIGPEVFEMRVPRGLYPFILSVRNDFPHSAKPAFTQVELDIADFLSRVSGISGSPPAPTSSVLHVIPWDGVTSTGITLYNTCPLDNWIMIFQALVKSNKLNLIDLEDTGQLISNILHLVDDGKYADAKLKTIPLEAAEVISGVTNLYGNEADFFIKLLQPYLLNSTTSTCDKSTCPQPVITRSTKTIALSYPSSTHHENIFVASLEEWVNPPASKCGQKYWQQPPADTPSFENVTLDEHGTPHVSWHCPGSRTWSTRSLDNMKEFVIFSVDFLSRANMLHLANIPGQITLCGKNFLFNAATLWNGSHYICTFNYGHNWYLYDGMKEYLRVNTGLQKSSVRFTEPHGYTVSYVIYTISFVP